MNMSASGRKKLTAREGVRLKAYKDSVGILTIGIGHTSMAGPPKVTSGMTITNAESDAIFARDLVKYENAVNKAVKVPLTQNQFDALTSLCFNIGPSAFAKSTLVKKLNAGDIQGAANAFLSWNKAGGKVIPGLVTRRKAERAQFLSGAQPPPPMPEPPPIPRPDPEPAPQPSWWRRLIDWFRSLFGLAKGGSRTVKGGAVALTGMAAEAGDVASTIAPLTEYAAILKYVFIGLTVIGVFYMLYARVDDKKKGKRQ
jgi:lysozyme